MRGHICMGKRRHINGESNIAVDQFWSIVLSVFPVAAPFPLHKVLEIHVSPSIDLSFLHVTNFHQLIIIIIIIIIVIIIIVSIVIKDTEYPPIKSGFSRHPNRCG